MTHLTRIARLIDRLNAFLGGGLRWFALFMVLAQFALVVMRYVFGIGAIALQESVIYAFALMFLLGAAETFRRGGHVRIDIFYEKFGEKGRALVDLLGCLFLLLPVTSIIFILSWSYVTGSWEIAEGSREAAGLPFVYLLKTALLLFCVQMALQGVSVTIRSFCTLRGMPIQDETA